MGQGSTRNCWDKDYLVSDKWKCEHSPSGAHYWLVDGFIMTCKFCNDTRSVNTDRYGWSKHPTKTRA